MPNKNKNAKKSNSSTPNGKQRPQRARQVPGNAVSTNPKSVNRVPRSFMRGTDTIVAHTETYGVNVTGSSDFSVFSQWALNPGLISYSRGSPLGSWLPQIAGNFDNYEIMNLRFHYRSACSTLQPGLVAFGYEPNPDGIAPSTYQDLRNMTSTDGTVHANLTFDVTSKVRGRQLLIRKGSVANYPSYDAGRVYLSTIGCTQGEKLGFVDVIYMIKLSNPQAASSGTLPPPSSVVAPFPTMNFQRTLVPSGTVINAAAQSLTWQEYLIDAVPQGATGLFTKESLNMVSMNLSASGCSFIQPAGVKPMLRVLATGRYRVSIDVNLDFEDLKMFAAMPVIYTPGSGGTGLWSAAKSMVYTGFDQSAVAEIPISAKAHRGFTGTAIGDPNPGTDLPLTASWDVYLTAGTYLCVPIGIRAYNAVSTTTANLTFRADVGDSRLTLSWVGS